MSGRLRQLESRKVTTDFDKQAKSLMVPVSRYTAVRGRLFRGSGSAPRSPSWLLWSYCSRGRSPLIARRDASHRPTRGLARVREGSVART